MNYCCHRLKSLCKEQLRSACPGLRVRAPRISVKDLWLTVNLRASAQGSDVSWCLHLKNNKRKQGRSEPSGGLGVCCGRWYLELPLFLSGVCGKVERAARLAGAGGRCAPLVNRGTGQRWTALICRDEWSSVRLLSEGKKYILCHNQIWFLFTNKFWIAFNSQINAELILLQLWF